MNGQNCDTPWKGNLRVMCKLGSVDPGAPTVRLQVNNVLVEKRIVNVFSVIKGFDDQGKNCAAQKSPSGQAVVAYLGPILYVTLISQMFPGSHLKQTVKADACLPYCFT